MARDCGTRVAGFGNICSADVYVFRPYELESLGIDEPGLNLHTRHGCNLLALHREVLRDRAGNS